jgi:hypothetical protein
MSKRRKNLPPSVVDKAMDAAMRGAAKAKEMGLWGDVENGSVISASIDLGNIAEISEEFEKLKPIAESSNNNNLNTDSGAANNAVAESEPIQETKQKGNSIMENPVEVNVENVKVANKTNESTNNPAAPDMGMGYLTLSEIMYGQSGKHTFGVTPEMLGFDKIETSELVDIALGGGAYATAQAGNAVAGNIVAVFSQAVDVLAKQNINHQVFPPATQIEQWKNYGIETAKIAGVVAVACTVSYGAAKLFGFAK